MLDSTAGQASRELGTCFDKLSTNGKFLYTFKPTPVHPELVEG